MAFWNRRRQIEQEVRELDRYMGWMETVKNPAHADARIQRLEIEIRVKRNEVMNALHQKFVHPRSVKIAYIRHELNILHGMVYAYMYVTGKWNNIDPISTEVTEEINDLALLYLSVDLTDMYARAYPITNVVQGIVLKG